MDTSNETWEPWDVHYILTGTYRWFCFRHRIEPSGMRSVMESVGRFKTRESALKRAQALNLATVQEKSQ